MRGVGGIISVHKLECYMTSKLLGHETVHALQGLQVFATGICYRYLLQVFATGICYISAQLQGRIISF